MHNSSLRTSQNDFSGERPSVSTECESTDFSSTGGSCFTTVSMGTRISENENRDQRVRTISGKVANLFRLLVVSFS